MTDTSHAHTPPPIVPAHILSQLRSLRDHYLDREAAYGEAWLEMEQLKREVDVLWYERIDAENAYQKLRDEWMDSLSPE